MHKSQEINCFNSQIDIHKRVDKKSESPQQLVPEKGETLRHPNNLNSEQNIILNLEQNGQEVIILRKFILKYEECIEQKNVENNHLIQKIVWYENLNIRTKNQFIAEITEQLQNIKKYLIINEQHTSKKLEVFSNKIDDLDRGIANNSQIQLEARLKIDEIPRKEQDLKVKGINKHNIIQIIEGFYSKKIEELNREITLLKVQIQKDQIQNDNIIQINNLTLQLEYKQKEVYKYVYQLNITESQRINLHQRIYDNDQIVQQLRIFVSKLEKYITIKNLCNIEKKIIKDVPIKNLLSPLLGNIENMDFENNCPIIFQEIEEINSEGKGDASKFGFSDALKKTLNNENIIFFKFTEYLFNLVIERFLVEQKSCGQKLDKSLCEIEAKIRKFLTIQENQIGKLKQFITNTHKLKESIGYYQIKYDDMRNIAEYEGKNVQIIKQKHAQIVRNIENYYKKTIKELREVIEKIKNGEIVDL